MAPSTGQRHRSTAHAALLLLLAIVGDACSAATAAQSHGDRARTERVKEPRLRGENMGAPKARLAPVTFSDGSGSRRSSPAAIARQRNEGNYHQRRGPVFQPTPVPSASPDPLPAVVAPQVAYVAHPPALYGHEVLHVRRLTTPPPVQRPRSPPSQANRYYGAYRRRRYSVHDDDEDSEDSVQVAGDEGARAVDAVADVPNPNPGDKSITRDQNKHTAANHDHMDEIENENEDGDGENLLQHPQEMRYFHDIFMRFEAAKDDDADADHAADDDDAGQYQARTFGHVEQSPSLFEQRMESQNPLGNRYRGEVIWADSTGGYGEHRWDMAQGKL